MAKKSRRARKQRGQPIRLSSTQLIQPGTDGTRGVIDAKPVRPHSESPNLQEEYGYVMADLKRIGILALVMLIILIVVAVLLT